MAKTFDDKKNISMAKHWGIALDIGYSSVKGFSPNKVFSFPSYAVKCAQQMISTRAGETDIIYRDEETKEVWIVGELAIGSIISENTNDSSLALFGRNRYFSPMFKVIARTGIGLGMMKNEYGSPEGKILHLQTGLPSAYKKTDETLLVEALSGHHHFSLKVGNHPWMTFQADFDDVNVMEQPLGTLLSVSIDDEGRQVKHAANYFKSNLIVFDPGFGTLDTFVIRNGFLETYDTDDLFGMRRVMERTVDTIFKKYHQDISVTELQKYLSTGKIRVFDRKNMHATLIDFSDILEEANDSVKQEAMEKMKTIYNNFFDYDYLIVTGGTGAAWYSYIKEHLSGMETLSIIPGNQNSSLPFIFSNVRGYYMYQLNHLRKLG